MMIMMNWIRIKPSNEILAIAISSFEHVEVTCIPVGLNIKVLTKVLILFPIYRVINTCHIALKFHLVVINWMNLIILGLGTITLLLT